MSANYWKAEGPLKVASDVPMGAVIGAAIEVHRHLGPGLRESVYELALMKELTLRGLDARRQVEIPAVYKGDNLGVGFRADIIVEDCLLLELKARSEIPAKAEAIFYNYFHLLKFKRGLMFNFHEKLLKDGIRRLSI